MLVSAALLGGLTLGVVSTVAQIVLLHDRSGLLNLAFLIPLAMVCWGIVPRLWAEPTPAVVRAVRAVAEQHKSAPLMALPTAAGSRELVLSRRL
jgi:hypothetical protein